MSEPADRPTAARLRDILAGFAGRRVLALGDMVADEYIVGRPVRLSREAALPALEWVDRSIAPGGATNLARNLRALGAAVAVAGVIGRDEPGAALQRQLIAEGIGVEALIAEADRPTSTVTRVIGGGPQLVSQQLARIDRKAQTEIGVDARARIAAFLRREIPRADALVISDYENGVINPDLIAAALPLAAAHNLSPRWTRTALSGVSRASRSRRRTRTKQQPNSAARCATTRTSAVARGNCSAGWTRAMCWSRAAARG